MNIRFNVTNKEVINILEKVDKSKRKFFIEEAVLNYYHELEGNPNKHSIFLKVEKKDTNGYIRFD